MPIQIPSSLPAMDVLESENIFVMTQERAIHQDIRPLKIIILNLMPLKSKLKPNCYVYWATALCKSPSIFCKPQRMYLKTLRHLI